MLRILSEKKQRAFLEANLGKSLPVLFESENKGGFISGYTPNYLRVSTPFNQVLANRVVECELTLPDEKGNMVVHLPQNQSLAKTELIHS
jgi:threonylcarbamoyladenosine tRNA methylthiotransferase MtaB